MCKLNELPNDEEKYNKILRYFDTDLDSLDWEELNKNKLKLSVNNADYIENILEYRAKIAIKEKKRYDMPVDLYANKKGFSRDNVAYIELYGTWHSKRYFLERRGVSFDLIWIEKTISCNDITSLKYKNYAERMR